MVTRRTGFATSPLLDWVLDRDPGPQLRRATDGLEVSFQGLGESTSGKTGADLILAQGQEQSRKGDSDKK